MVANVCDHGGPGFRFDPEITDIGGMARPLGWRRWRWPARVGLGLLLLVVTGVGTLLVLSRQAPAFYQEWQAQTPEQQQQAEQSLHDKLLALAASLDTKSADIRFTLRGSGEDEASSRLQESVPVDFLYTLDLTNAEIMVLVRDHLEVWLKQRRIDKPQGLLKPVVAVVEGQPMMAFTYKSGSFKQVFSGQFTIHLTPDGMAGVELIDLRAGKVPVPIQSITQTLIRRTPEDERGAARRVGRSLEALRDYRFRPVFELAYRRRARIVRYQTLEDGVRLSLRVQDHQRYKALNDALAAVAVP